MIGTFDLLFQFISAHTGGAFDFFHVLMNAVQQKRGIDELLGIQTSIRVCLREKLVVVAHKWRGSARTRSFQPYTHDWAGSLQLDSAHMQQERNL